MSTRKLHNTDQLLQLERVVQTRLRSAEQALNIELDSLRRIEDEIKERQAKVNALNSNLLDVQDFLDGDTENGQPITATDYKLGLNRRYWIDYDKQREDYYLGLTHDEHSEQMQKVNEARLQVKSLECKYEILLKKISTSRRQRIAEKTRQQEVEIQDSRFHVSHSTGYPS